MIFDPHKNPDPKAAQTIISPLLILSDSSASDMQIGIDAAVVFPYL